MTKKKKIIIGVAAGVVVVSWAILGSLASFGAGAVMWNSGGLGTEYNTAVAVKDFEPLELVFVTTTVKNDRDAAEVHDLLLKEAQKLGGHGIINVNIDTQRKGWFGEVTVTGSALAIKYTDSVGVPTTGNSFGGLSRMMRGFGGWRN
ncbi:hypothetical protein AGMMS49944_19130 [Spirochaetia bacterium]|nr:hypothetical protein AGMMS49944_19130 [Spirochaetia bacterium]